MSFVISDPAVVINNEPVATVPGTFKYTEGFGESNVRARSTGNGNTTSVYSEDVTTKFSKFSLELYSDIDSIELARSLKAARNANVVTVNGVDPTTGNSITRSFNRSAVTNDYEVEFGSDTTFTLDFMSDPAV